MSVPQNIITELTKLQVQVAAAQPLEQASFATLKAIELNAQQLEADTSIALINAAGTIDTWVAPRDSPSIVAGFNTVVSSARDQWRIADMLFVISRANLNVDLILGNVIPPLPPLKNRR